MKRLVMAVVLAATLLAAKAPAPACSITPTADPAVWTLTAWNLPTNDELGFSPDLYPIMGVSAPTGTLTRDWWYPQVYVWERGGGKSLIKPGPGLNDYHVIAFCSAT